MERNIVRQNPRVITKMIKMKLMIWITLGCLAGSTPTDDGSGVALPTNTTAEEDDLEIEFSKTLGLTVDSTAVLIASEQQSSLSEVRLSFPALAQTTKDDMTRIETLVSGWAARTEVAEDAASLAFVNAQIGKMTEMKTKLGTNLDRFYEIFKGITNNCLLYTSDAADE